MLPLFNPDNISANFCRYITTIDSHTEGESTRLIVDGIGDIPGLSMMDKLSFFRSNLDHVRCQLTKEPRGSREILAAAITENINDNSSFGLLYMDAKRYPYLCGHATIGAITTLWQTGFLKLKEGENTVLVDTPAGVMNTMATVINDRVTSVAINMVPSFVYNTDKTIVIEDFGKITIDIVCTGGFFAMVDTNLLGIEPVLKNKGVLVKLGMKIIEAANQQLQVAHPVQSDVTSVDVCEFYDSEEKEGVAQGRSLVIYGESHMDRSPCGTGTAAKLALLHNRQKLAINQPYINSSPLGTSFKASLVEEVTIGHLPAVVTKIEGRAWVTGVHHFLLDETDPFPHGFLI
jgi:proline racemase